VLVRVVFNPTEGNNEKFISAEFMNYFSCWKDSNRIPGEESFFINDYNFAESKL